MGSGGREVEEGGDTCIPTADYVGVWQRPTQYCKAITPQLKINILIKMPRL